MSKKEVDNGKEVARIETYRQTKGVIKMLSDITYIFCYKVNGEKRSKKVVCYSVKTFYDTVAKLEKIADDSIVTIERSVTKC